VSDTTTNDLYALGLTLHETIERNNKAIEDGDEPREEPKILGELLLANFPVTRDGANAFGALATAITAARSFGQVTDHFAPLLLEEAGATYRDTTKPLLERYEAGSKLYGRGHVLTKDGVRQAADYDELDQFGVNLDEMGATLLQQAGQAFDIDALVSERHVQEFVFVAAAEEGFNTSKNGPLSVAKPPSAAELFDRLNEDERVTAEDKLVQEREQHEQRQRSSVPELAELLQALGQQHG